MIRKARGRTKIPQLSITREVIVTIGSQKQGSGTVLWRWEWNHRISVVEGANSLNCRVEGEEPLLVLAFMLPAITFLNLFTWDRPSICRVPLERCRSWISTIPSPVYFSMFHNLIHKSHVFSWDWEWFPFAFTVIYWDTTST